MLRVSSPFLACLTLPSLVAVAGCPVPEDEPGEGSTGNATSDASDSADPSADESTGAIPDTCPVPTSGPTMHPGNNVTADEVWSADGSPHLIPYDFTVSARIEVEPCAVVQLAAGRVLTFVEGGELVAEGLPDRPIVFERSDPDAAWSTIRLYGGTASFAYATIDGGGLTGNTYPDLTGALIVRGRAGVNSPDGTLAVSHVEIRRSQAAGVRLDGFGAFTADSDDLTITEGESHPISASATDVGSIPAGAYDGNADDQIVLTTGNVETISSDTTIHDRGVPYYIGLPGQIADLRVQTAPGSVATLTIEPGVVMRFAPGSVFNVGHGSSENPATGALIAVGTEDAPIVLTSAADSPAAGDWLGVDFGETPNPADRLDWVHLEYAGGVSTSGSDSCPYPTHEPSDAAIRIFGVPPDAFITNTTITASAAHGIDRGWRDDVIVDLLDSNSFDVAWCEQTYPKDGDGACPTDPPCP